MFPDLSWSHMLLVLVVALVVVGPKDLPKLMHTMGRWAGKARAMADQFRKSFDEMARQSELDELRKELDELRNMRPLAETERTVNEALQPPDISVVPKEKPEAAEPSGIVHEDRPQAVEPSEPIGEGHEPRAP
jgi:sec-independent protein translocase protein TatB